jgi:hypothetical protein
VRLRRGALAASVISLAPVYLQVSPGAVLAGMTQRSIISCFFNAMGLTKKRQSFR